MKILHLLKSNSYSGAENVVISLIKGLQKAFPTEYKCIYVSPKGPIEEYLVEEEISYIPLVSFSRKEIKRVISVLQPDILHVHDYSASVLGALSDSNLPIISHLHHNPFWAKKINLKTISYAFCVSRFSIILSVSDSIINEFRFRMIRKKAKVISNPIMLSKIQTLAEKESKDRAFSSDMIFIGRLSEAKNPQRFICLFEKINKRLPEVTGVMVGGGELEEECRKIINEKGLNNIVKLTGFVKNPYMLLKNSKLLCVPSRWEGFGLVAVEALALGIPVVATPVGGLSMIVNNSCGKLCITDEEFIEEIYTLLTEAEYMQKKEVNAKKRAKELENFDEYINTVNSLYSKFLK